jgi:low affinity Fe/Cu permease
LKLNPAIYWATSTAVAAVIMLGYIHNFVYTRTEGEKLEKRVEAISSQNRDDFRALNRKVDEIYRLIVQAQSKGRRR